MNTKDGVEKYNFEDKLNVIYLVSTQDWQVKTDTTF